MDNKIVGGTVATTFPVPTKLSDLTDDTGVGLWGVNYAKQSYISDEAYCDGKGNIITDTYATKKEIESNNQFIDEEFARKDSVPTKISDLDDDTLPTDCIEFSEHSNFSEEAGVARTAIADSKGNDIIKTYATKSSLTDTENNLKQVESIAKGRATGYVFNTVEDMNLWLVSDQQDAPYPNTDLLNLGDNLYIRATDVPDYWWDGSAAQPLETQKVDLTEYVKNTDYATVDKAGVIKVSTDATRGVILHPDKVLTVACANKNHIAQKASYNQPITPVFLEYAVEVCTNQDINAELTEAQLKLPLSTQSVKDEIYKVGELIEEIIITDENNAKEIKRNIEPDGTQYDFKAMTVYYEIKPCTVQNLVSFKVYDGANYSNSNILIDYQGSCTVTTSGRFVQAYFDIFAGLWICIGNTTTIQGSPTTLQGWRMNHSALYTGQRIKSLNILSHTTDMFEVGSVIRIYGVR